MVRVRVRVRVNPYPNPSASVWFKMCWGKEVFKSAFSEVLGTMRMHSFFLFRAGNERF